MEESLTEVGEILYFSSMPDGLYIVYIVCSFLFHEVGVLGLNFDGDSGRLI